MKKAIITTLVAIALIIGGAILEHISITNSFNEMKEKLNTVYVKADNETAERSDIERFRESWLEHKKFLHCYIPHNDIKDVEVYLAEAEALIIKKHYGFALSKLNVLKQMFEHLPKTYDTKPENIL